MSAFDRIIGYDYIKNEMLELVDMLKNPEIYTKLGATLPSGVVLSGEPGLGKTLIATAFMEECGVKSYTLRRSKETKEFIEEMNEVFENAKNNAPSVILLDDMDKYAPEEKNSEEFAILQALIDSVKKKNVFLIATVNAHRHELPESLTRAGRFDRFIHFYHPSKEDGASIVKYYIGKKTISDDVNIEDTSKMLAGKSCAELDSVINIAAISAAYERSEKIKMKHLVDATLREAYGVGDDCDKLTPEEREAVAYHEAGHAVISDVLKEGSVGMASICTRGGFMLRCLDFDRRAYEILVSLGGKAASELKYGKIASGTCNDLVKSIRHIGRAVTEIGTNGMSFLSHCVKSEASNARSDIAIQAELERYLFKAKEILCDNREYLDKLAAELIEKETLLNSDIARIRANCTIKPAIVG